MEEHWNIHLAYLEKMAIIVSLFYIYAVNDWYHIRLCYQLFIELILKALVGR